MPCSPTWRVIAARESHDEVVRIGGLGGGDDLGLGRVRPAERDILAHRAAKQEDVLSDIGELARAAKRRDTPAMFWPSMTMAPPSTSQSRRIRLRMVDLPPPEGPTRAVTFPGSATNDRFLITLSPGR